ncbi:LysR family transcriptional regulator [Paracidovorax valerianellae]|uniref:DNA-binding transcriptional regulator, LysR family n=1 Tax=Paracidovorax valerianellae TaxID=187868 RepID=A0A1G7C241_9BURK|nr:LysR family transcriptional regulator [Paracidovorax valerianellae]MDA8446594.1 LysR family transcriptional regulator [Paracidovorax valerianellae]SDE33349.1 DNA-binding transcriptional regulator, LysR family [Paracidovorax valerianellae]
MELRHIRYFLAVAEEGNFTRAAARLGMAQPPLSLQIKDLEREVGVPLFHRVPHGAQLTDAGRAFLEGVGGLPARAGDAVRAAQRAARGEAGVLHLGFTGSSALNPVVIEAIRSYRRGFAQVELKIDEGNSLTLVERLRDGRLDIAILRPDGLDATGLRWHRYPDEPLIVALPASHAAARRGPRIDLQPLHGEPFILTPRPLGPSLFDASVAACRAAGFEPVLGPTAPQIVSILALVAAELGVALVPASMRHLAFKGVAYRALHSQSARVSLAIAHREGDRSPFVEHFVALARPDSDVERDTGAGLP